MRPLRYSLCRVSFDPESRTFGSVVDTIFQAETEGQSIFVSPCLARRKISALYNDILRNLPYPAQRCADLCMFDLSTGCAKFQQKKRNSPDTDSYHSWSSNSKWVVFSSRRLDGLYTRPFIAHVVKEAFSQSRSVLPQKSTILYISHQIV